MRSDEIIRDPDTGEEFVRGPAGTLRRRCPPDCTDGYRPVTDVYAAGIADPETDPARYAAALRSVYPCPTCNPEVHRLWSEGHFHPDHASTGGCPECRHRPTGRARR